jgi:DNA-directed RNA polymerase specialized sigma24 family protein
MNTEDKKVDSEDKKIRSAMEKEVEQRFDSFMKTVIHNAKANYEKHESKGWHNKTIFLEDIPEYSYECDSLGAEIFEIENFAFKVTNPDLVDVLKSMPKELRDITLLAFMGDLSDNEIALIINMKRRTVNDHKHKALIILREHLL